MRKKRFWNWHHIQYYKFNEYLDLIPYAELSLDCGFIAIGWLGYTFSLHILPKCKRKSKYWTLIDKKLYMILANTDFYTPRILVCKDTVSFLLGCVNFEYEK